MAESLHYENVVRFPSDTTVGHELQEKILQLLSDQGFSEKVLFGIRLSVEEALINAIKHGNKLDPDKQVRVSYTINNEHFLIEIEDQGNGFDPSDIPDPTAPENLERPSGRGLLLMKAYMTECEFLEGGTVCRMKRIRE